MVLWSGASDRRQPVRHPEGRWSAVSTSTDKSFTFQALRDVNPMPSVSVAADGATTVEAQQTMMSWSRRDVRRVFSGLTAAEPGDMVGRWDGTMVGSRSLRLLNRATAVFTPLRGWCGKQVEGTGLVHNRVRRGGSTRLATDCWVSRGESLLDGRPAVVADYSRTAKPPVKWLRGEMRWLVPGEQILGVLLFPIGRRAIGPFPFQMTRSPD